MTDPKPLHQITLNVTGKVLMEDQYAQAAVYVYQRTKPGCGNLNIGTRQDRMLRKHTPGAPAPSLNQNLVRWRFQDAIAAWKALDPATQAEWEQRARSLVMTGYNLFLREFFRANPLPDLTRGAAARRYIAACGIPLDRNSLTGHALWREFLPGHSVPDIGYGK